MRMQQQRQSAWPLVLAGACMLIAGMVWWSSAQKPPDPAATGSKGDGQPVVIIQDPGQNRSDPAPVREPDPILPFEYSTDEALACRKALLNAMWPMFDGSPGSLGRHGDELYEWTHVPSRLTAWVEQIGVELERIPTEAEAAAFVQARIAERPAPAPFPTADDVVERIHAISADCADGVEAGADYIALLKTALANYIGGELGDRWQTQEIIIPAVGAAVDEAERAIAGRRLLAGPDANVSAASIEKEFRLLLNVRLKDARLRYRLNHNRGW